MIRNFFFLIVALLCAPAFANDIAVAAPDGNSGWFLLEDPLGPAGNGLSLFAGDPGLPAPDALGWPHVNGTDADGSYPTTELWKFTDGAPGTWQRATRFLDHQGSGNYRRTLYAVFLIDGVPHVLHYDPYMKTGGYTQVLRADDASSANGDALVARIKQNALLNTKEFLDAPEVSPDGKHIAFRTAVVVNKTFEYRLRVYSTSDWKQVAEIAAGPTSRSTWVDDNTLAYIAWEGALPKAPQAEKTMSWYVRIFDSHKPVPGKLKLATLKDGALTETELLAGSFPPDHYTRTLQMTPKGLLLARQEGEGVVTELRAATPDAEPTTVAKFETFRGCAVKSDGVTVTGIRTIDRSKAFVVVEHSFAPDATPTDRVIRAVSTDGHGGWIDLGHGVEGVIEAVANPEYDHAKQEGQLLRHTMAVLNWRGCDTMRNPRVIQQLSKMVRRFKEIGEVNSTLLVFDIEIAANGGKNEKKGRYVELYGNAGRKGGGRIRTEDNLGGQWIVQAIDGGGDKDTDDYYSCVETDDAMEKKSAKNAGKAYDDLVTQLEARKLLMLNDVDNDPLNGGLEFRHRAYFRDPNSGAHWRTWVFVKYGRIIDPDKHAALTKEIEALRKDREKEGADVAKIDGEIALREFQMQNLRERLVIHFVADLPNGSAGDWNFPHALAQVEMRFALSNQQDAAVTNLYFEPDKWIALPDVTAQGNNEKKPELLLPRTFRIFNMKGGKAVKELEAKAVDPSKPVPHPEKLVKGGKLQPGYNIPKAAYSWTNAQFVNKQR